MCLLDIAYHRLIGLENNLSISSAGLYLSIAPFILHVCGFNLSTYTYVYNIYIHI